MIYPRKCPVCGEILTKKDIEPVNPYICKYCYDGLSFAKSNKTYNKKYDKEIHLLKHDENAEKILYDLKYSNKRDNADFLARETVLKSGEEIRCYNADVIIPVPLHKKREFERGFNQAFLIAEKISGELKKQFNEYIPVEEKYLIRKEKTKPQKDLGINERLENVKGKFDINPDNNKQFRTIILIDDIFTTGATVNECSKILKKYGAEKVIVLTMSVVER